MITLTNGRGRFANHFLRNMGFHFIAEKADIAVSYGFNDEFKRMGINFHSGSRTMQPGGPTVVIDDNTFLDVMKVDSVQLKRHNFVYRMYQSYFQKAEFCKILYEHFRTQAVKDSVIAANPHAARYGSNKDVFVHIRLDDVTERNPGFHYYDSVLSKLEFTKGYISSDTIDHSICKDLITKYNLTIIDKSPEETVQFASTCRHLILSHGTFSWLMALLGYNADNVYYPKIKQAWHGDIFVLPGMTEVDY
jgi:hypothetical protein